MSKLGTFSTFCFWGGYKLLRLGLEAIHAVPDQTVYLRVYTAWCTLSSCKQWQNVLGCIWMYLNVSGCTWSYLDVPRCIWIKMAEPSLRYFILFPGSDRTYLDISGCIWKYLVKDEYKYEVKWGNDSIQTSSTPCPAGEKTVFSLMRIMRIMFEYSP